MTDFSQEHEDHLAKSQRPRNLLLVEDDDHLRKGLRVGLERRGYTVFELASGLGVEQLVKQHAIDVVVTDLFMPEREGIETIRALHCSSPEVPIVVITGSGFSPLATQLGACTCLAKPFSLGDLGTVLERVTAK